MQLCSVVKGLFERSELSDFKLEWTEREEPEEADADAVQQSISVWTGGRY